MNESAVFRLFTLGIASMVAIGCGAGNDSNGGDGPELLDGLGGELGTAGVPAPGAGGSTGFGVGGRASGAATGSTGGATGGGPGGSGGTTVGTGGAIPGTGGAQIASGGVLENTGGTVPSTGGTQIASGGMAAGGTLSATGGVTETGGAAATGGTPSTGGVSGMQTGGAENTGGLPATGGTENTGGTPPTGGTENTGGTPTTGGSTATGGSDECVYPDPPGDVSAWVDESWADQLGSNINGRQAWLLDNAMMGQGQINLCVRWGATSAPSQDVKANMASTVNRWMNHWFSQLEGYGCFPYPNITVKVTGWAVAPGNESWVSGLDDSIAVYTEMEDGEPRCPKECSFFDNHWDHQFPSCPGGEAFHSDYWIWLDNELPGSGAAAVGGDWGLRMPVSSFVNAMGNEGDLVIEHEMGHGFGFQDYYSWTGSTPAGGSLMIVGSTSSQTPTTADQWLLRRTWQEMQKVRDW